jgi:hypothetical protein
VKVLMLSGARSYSGPMLLVQAMLLGACGCSALPGGADASVDSSVSVGVACDMPDADLDYSCTSDSDCVAVPGGSPCAPNCWAACNASAVNAGVADLYLADFNARATTDWQAIPCMCDCRPVHPCCHLGTCSNSCACDFNP